MKQTSTDLLNLIYSYEKIITDTRTIMRMNGHNVDLGYNRVIIECNSALVDLYKQLLNKGV